MYMQCAAGFANEGQFLLASEASLGELNARLPPAPGQAPIGMTRFRPNLVVGGGGLAPFAEDAWRGLALGAAQLRVVGAPAHGRLARMFVTQCQASCCISWQDEVSRRMRCILHGV